MVVRPGGCPSEKYRCKLKWVLGNEWINKGKSGNFQRVFTPMLSENIAGSGFSDRHRQYRQYQCPVFINLKLHFAISHVHHIYALGNVLISRARVLRDALADQRGKRFGKMLPAACFVPKNIQLRRCAVDKTGGGVGFGFNERNVRLDVDNRCFVEQIGAAAP